MPWTNEGVNRGVIQILIFKQPKSESHFRLPCVTQVLDKQWVHVRSGRPQLGEPQFNQTALISGPL